MKHYLVTDEIDWADEFDVCFYEILNEDQYKLFSFAKKVLKNFYGSYYFGTNEGFDGDFDFLAFEPKELTETEYEVLLHLDIRGENFYYRFRENLVEFLQDNYHLSTDKDEDDLTEEEIIEALKKYEDMCNE